MEFEDLYKSINIDSSEVKYFESAIGRKIFLQANIDWEGK